MTLEDDNTDRLIEILAVLKDIRELLAWQPGVPQSLWTERRMTSEVERQQLAREIQQQISGRVPPVKGNTDGQ